MSSFHLSSKYQVTDTKLRYKKVPLKAIKVKLPWQVSGKTYTQGQVRQSIESLRQEIQQKYPNQYDIAISVRDVHHGWRGGKFSNTHYSDFYLWSPSDYDREFENQGVIQDFEVDDYAILVRPTQSPPSAPKMHPSLGTDGPNHDCVWNCLQGSLGSRNPWKKPEDLKRFLGLERNEQVPLRQIPQIEAQLDDVRIEIIPDSQYPDSPTYVSEKDAHMTLTWYSQNDHVCLDKTTVNYYGRHFSRLPKKIKLFQEDTKNREVKSLCLMPVASHKYHPVRQTWSGPPEHNQFRNIYFKSLEKATDPRWEHFIEVADKSKDLTKEYLALIKSNRILFKELDIDYFKTGNTTYTALEYFYRTIQHLPLTATATMDEQKWLHFAYKGGLQYARKSSSEYCGHKYDYVSFYPSLMASDLLYPIKNGEFKIVDQWISGEPAIYRATVERGHPYYRYNQDDYYTHADLQSAKRLNLEVTLIQDGENNCLWYGRERCIKGNTIFGEFVYSLFRLKQVYGKKNCPHAKLILNTLSGILGQQSRKTKTVSKEVVETEDLDTIIDVNFSDSGKWLVRYLKEGHIFKYPHLCFFSPFLNSYGREKVINNLSDLENSDILHIHTDGFVLTEFCETDSEGLLGDIEYEGTEKCRILHVNKVQKYVEHAVFDEATNKATNWVKWDKPQKNHC